MQSWWKSTIWLCWGSLCLWLLKVQFLPRSVSIGNFHSRQLLVQRQRQLLVRLHFHKESKKLMPLTRHLQSSKSFQLHLILTKSHHSHLCKILMLWLQQWQHLILTKRHKVHSLLMEMTRNCWLNLLCLDMHTFSDLPQHIYKVLLVISVGPTQRRLGWLI